MLAACALVALEDNVARLAEDHANATFLAKELRRLPSVTVDIPVETNIVFFRLDPARISSQRFADAMAANGVKLSAAYCAVDGMDNMCRAVTHVDVTRQDLERLVEAAQGILTGSAP